MNDWDLRRHIEDVLRTEGRFGFRGEIGSVDDTGDLQTIVATGHAGEEVSAVHRVQPHGFASNPPAGAHGLVLPLGGERILSVALGGEHQDVRQKNLPTGTAVLYDASGNCVRAYGQDGIQVEAASGDIYVKPAKGKKLYHGGKPGDGGQYIPVMLSDGSASSNVYARKG